MTERRAVAAMVLATLLWGATFVVVRDSLRDWAAAPLVAGRFLGAALLWAAFLAWRRRGARPAPAAVRAAWIGGLVSAPLTALGYLFQAIGLQSTSAGSSAFLTSAGTLLAALFAWPLLGLRPSPRLAAGLVLAALGSALMGIRGNLSLGPGEAWTLVGAAIYAIQICAVARWAKSADAPRLAAVQTGATALLLAPWLLGPGMPLAGADIATWLRLGYLVVAGTVLAPWLQIAAQRTLPPGRVGLLFALEPVFGLGFALGVGGESFAGRWWAGAALILAAVTLVEMRAAASSRRSSR